MQVFLRHSITQKNNYHFLYSDIDFSVVSNLSDDEFKKLAKLFDRIRAYIPIIGEAEIYTAIEWQQKQLFDTNFHAIYDRIRNLRKIQWMRAYLLNTSGKNFFAIKRSQRGLKKAIAKINCRASVNNFNLNLIISFELNSILKSFTDQNYGSIVSKIDTITYYNPILALNLSNEYESSDTYFLSTLNCILWAAILPVSHYNVHEVDLTLEDLRNTQIIKDFFIKICDYEKLVLVASGRGYIVTPQWLNPNIQDIDNCLVKFK